MAIENQIDRETISLRSHNVCVDRRPFTIKRLPYKLVENSDDRGFFDKVAPLSCPPATFATCVGVNGHVIIPF